MVITLKKPVEDKEKAPEDIGIEIFRFCNTESTPITGLRDKLVEAGHYEKPDDALNYILKTIHQGEFYDRAKGEFASEEDRKKVACVMFNLDQSEFAVRELISTLNDMDKGFKKYLDDLMWEYNS